MDFDDIEISSIGKEEAIDDVDDNEDLNEDYEPRQESLRQGSPLDEEDEDKLYSSLLVRNTSTTRCLISSADNDSMWDRMSALSLQLKISASSACFAACSFSSCSSKGCSWGTSSAINALKEPTDETLGLSLIHI